MVRVPHFIIGGAPRSGTTFLCHVLDSHPDIFMAKPFIPEPKIFMTPCEDGRSDYLKRYEPFFKRTPLKQILGEKSSGYLENEGAFERICQTFRKMKFIFIVREPVERAYSNYLWSTKNGLETLSFEKAIELEGRRENPLPQLPYARPYDYLTRGDYGKFAKRYIEFYGDNNVKFFLYENLLLSQKHFFQEIQNFIEVDYFPLHSLELKPVNIRDREAPSLSPLLAKELKERMRPFVEKFANYVDIDISAWGY